MSTYNKHIAHSLIFSWVHGSFQVLPAGVVKGIFDGLKSVCALQPGLHLSGLAGRGQPDYRASSHAVSHDTTAGSASQLRHNRDRATRYSTYYHTVML